MIIAKRFRFLHPLNYVVPASENISFQSPTGCKYSRLLAQREGMTVVGTVIAFVKTGRMSLLNQQTNEMRVFG